MEFPDLDMIWDKGKLLCNYLIDTRDGDTLLCNYLKGKYAANMERFRRLSYNGTSFEGHFNPI